MFEGAIRINTATFGRMNHNVATDLWNWAEFLRNEGREDEARGAWAEACGIYQQTLGEENPKTTACIGWWQ